MSNQLAAAARMQPNMANFGFQYQFPPQMIQDAMNAAAAMEGSNNDGSSSSRTDHEGEEYTAGDDTNELNPNGEGKYMCPTCQRVFSRMYNLKSHIRTHQNHRPFQCPNCSMKFTRNHDLNRHLKVHSKDRPHTCSSCGRTFARRDALRRHERMDPEGKKVHCVSTSSNSNNTYPSMIDNYPAVLAAAAAAQMQQNLNQQQLQPDTGSQENHGSVYMNGN